MRWWCVCVCKVWCVCACMCVCVCVCVCVRQTDRQSACVLVIVTHVSTRVPSSLRTKESHEA